MPTNREIDKLRNREKFKTISKILLVLVPLGAILGYFEFNYDTPSATGIIGEVTKLGMDGSSQYSLPKLYAHVRLSNGMDVIARVPRNIQVKRGRGVELKETRRNISGEKDYLVVKNIQ